MKVVSSFSILFLLLFCGSIVQGADRYWVAISGTSNWNSTANWSTSSGGSGGASVPGLSDVAHFDGARSGNCSINTMVNVASIVISNYTGTITQNNYTVTSTSFSQAGGHYYAGSVLDIDGNFSLNGGYFYGQSSTVKISGNFSRTSGSFYRGTSTFLMDGAAATLTTNAVMAFHNFTIEKNDGQVFTLPSADYLQVWGELKLVNGLANNGQFNARGNVTVQTGFDGGSASLEFLGTVTQNFILTDAIDAFDGDIYLNKANGYPVIMGSDLTMNGIGQDMYMQAGALTLGGYAITVYNPGSGSGSTIVEGSFNISGNGTYNSYDYAQVAGGNFTITSGSPTFRIYNDFNKSVSSAHFNAGSASVYIDGEFNNSTGSFYASSNNSNFGGNFLFSGGSFFHNGGTVHFTGNDASYDTYTTIGFNHVTFNKNDGQTLSIAGSDIINVNGTITYSNGKVSGSQVNARGGVDVEPTFDGGDSRLVFTGTVTQNFDLSGAEDKFQGDIYLQHGNGYTVALNSDLTLAYPGQNMILISGKLNLNGHDLTIVNSGGTAGTLFGSGTYNIVGNGNIECFDYNQDQGGNIILEGNGITMQVLHNFTKTVSSAHFTTNGNTLYILNDFINSAGTFYASSSNMYLGGDFNFQGGTFVHNGGTFHLMGDNSNYDSYANISFKNVVFDKNDGQGVNILESDVPYVYGTLTFQDGLLNNSKIYTYGNVNVEPAWDGGTAQLSFNNGGNQIFDLSGATDKYDGDIIFQNANGYVVSLASDLVLDAAGQVLYLTSGELFLNGNDVFVKNDVNNTGAVTGQGSATISGSGSITMDYYIQNVSGNITLESDVDFIVLKNFQMTGSTGAQFHGENGVVTILGDLTTTVGQFHAPNSTLSLGGNWNVAGYYYPSANGILKFIGEGATLTTDISLPSVEIAKDSGFALTISFGTTLTISSSITFTSGLVNTSTTNSAGHLTLTNSATAYAGTDCDNPISYVNGPLGRIISDRQTHNLFYPIGKSGNYRPTWLEPTQETKATTTYRVEQFEGYPPNYCVPDDLACLSKVRWYRVERSNIEPIRDPITISYCSDDGVTHPANLRIAKQDGSCWKNMGGMGTDATKGTITSTVDFSEYGDFVLANDSNCLNPLPVQMFSFEGNYRDGVEYLKWVTASEKNNDRFEVMRSEDGINWYMIGEVQGNGFSEKLQEYFYEDHNIPMGATVLYYRLRQVDYNGDFEYHPIIVQDLTNSKITFNSINVFPNPAKDRFSVVNLGNTRMPITLEVIDLYGHVLLQKDFTGNTDVNTFDYPTGIYMLKITNAAGMVIDFRKVQVRK